MPVMCGAPPEVEHGKPMGSSRDGYPVNSIVRYECDAGYTQRHLPVIHCMENGEWQQPKVECIEGELRGNSQNMGLTSTFLLHSLSLRNRAGRLLL